MPGGHIQLVALTKQFTEVAVDSIDLTVDSGEFFSLLGPSGCGKTTTLRLIAGFEQPTSGRILLDGTDMAGVPPHKRNVNTVFQSYALFPFLSVFDNVAFGLRYQKLSKAETDQAGARGARPGPDELVREAPPRAAVRRPAAAGGAGPRPGPRARRAAAGRAARRPRRQAAPLAQGGTQGAPGAGRHHLPLRHPRPGGSADHVGPAGRDELRPDRPARHAAGHLRGTRGHLRGRLPGRVEPDGSGRGGARPRPALLRQGRRVLPRRRARSTWTRWAPRTR